MPNYLDKNLRGGDRSEYLAQYILSALGVAVQVPRPEDHGFDYFCSLQREEGRRLTFHSPFSVQLGSVDGSVSHKEFAYGGLTDHKDPEKRQHKDWEIEFLRKQRLPFFVGTADKTQHRLRLYSTGPMWYVLHRNTKIGEIILCPEDTRNLDTESKDGEILTPEGLSLPRLRIPLGLPVIDLSIMDLLTDKVDKAAKALEYAIRMEQQNLVYRDLDVQYFLRLDGHTPNEEGATYQYSFVPDRGVVEKTPNWLRPIMIMLALAYKRENNDLALEKLRGMLTLLPLSDVDKTILRKHAGLTF